MPALTVDELRQTLGQLKLDTRGTKDTLKKRLARHAKLHAGSPSSPPLSSAAPDAPTRPPEQLYDSYLVFDVEATCERIEGPYGRLAFAYPNEIIEWPVILLQWRRRAPAEHAEGDGGWELVKTDEYHSFVKPTWKPVLSAFCTELTGITQSDVDAAPTFPGLCQAFHRDFILRHRLFTPANKTVWVTDGPWDLRDFVAKTCYLSRTPRPPWLAGEMVDLRILTANFFSALKKQRRSPSPPSSSANSFSALVDTPQPPKPKPPLPVGEEPLPTPLAAPAAAASSPFASAPYPAPSEPTHTYLPSHQLTAPPTLSLPSVLSALTLPPFQGRLHSGLSDARNAARILIDLAARGVRVEPNRRVPEGGRGGERRWGWMTRTGEVKWEEHVRWEEGRAAKGARAEGERADKKGEGEEVKKAA
ncbi:hypothetical protein JCM10207_000964 [Rhodosporidiobolus poonsookiae]